MGVHHLRHAIEAEIELHLDRVTLLLARLDAQDAPLDDLEEEIDASPEELTGEAPSDDGRALLPDRLLYAVDQRGGPINYDTASEEWRAREYGLVRTASGGWRHAH